MKIYLTCSDIQKLKKFTASRPASQEILKEVLKAKRKKLK